MRREEFLGLSPHGFHRVAYTEWGEVDNPRVLVCVHGLTRNSRDFDALAQYLSPDYRVVCPDVVGRGASDWLAVKSDYSYPQYMADMNALLARLNVDSVDWVGTSMGGLIGMMLAALPKSPIRRLVMNDVGPFIPKAALERIASYVGKFPRMESVHEVELYLRVVLAGFGKLTDAQWQHLAQHSARESRPGEFGLRYDPDIASAFSVAPLQDVNLWPYWHQVLAPVLLIRGAQSDLLLTETARLMTASRDNVELLEIADAGHAPALMENDQMERVKAFLLRGTQ